jgi:enoyl-CoA hydratase/carnithine racemase
LIVASSRASFSTPGIKFGVFCSTPGVALARLVSSKIALRMLLTGEALKASDALTHGVVSELVSVADELNEVDSVRALEERVAQVVGMIEANSGPIVALGKRAFYEQTGVERIEESYERATKAMCENLRYVDCQKGLSAFAAKKKPVWSHSTEKV